MSSASDAIERVRKRAYEQGYEQGKADALRWILSTERLPDENTEVLVCYISTGWIEKDELDGDGEFMWWDGTNWNIEDTAWMPLPEPYREETEDE